MPRFFAEFTSEMSTTDFTRAKGLLCLMMLGTAVLAQDSPVKICLNDTHRNRTLNVTLTCAPGTVISVGEAFFGRNQWGLCSYTDDDCTEDINSFQSCNHERNCTRNFNGTYTPRCGYSTFLTVVYDCVVGVLPTPPTRVDPVPDPNRYNRPLTTRSPAPRHVGSLDPVVTPKSRDDTALIAGCAVAVVVTMTFLIIAIVLVIRRLFCVQQDVVHQSPKKSRISVFICTKLGCALASCRSADPAEGGNSQQAPIQEADLDEEGRVTPLGADAVEEVRELGRPDVTSGPSTSTSNVSVSVASDNISALDTRMNRVSRHSNNSTSRPSSFRPDGSSSPDSSTQGRLDAVALPNTELSTLC